MVCNHKLNLSGELARLKLFQRPFRIQRRNYKITSALQDGLPRYCLHGIVIDQKKSGSHVLLLQGENTSGMH
jgi:hypothetical protein